MGLFDSNNSYKYIGTKNGAATIFDDADLAGDIISFLCHHDSDSV